MLARLSLMTMRELTIARSVGRNVIEIGMTRRSIHATSSCAISTYPADGTARSSMTAATANTRCEGLKRGLSRPSAHSAWCARATCAATTTAPPIHGQATSAICANRASSEPSTCLANGIMSSY